MKVVSRMMAFAAAFMLCFALAGCSSGSASSASSGASSSPSASAASSQSASASASSASAASASASAASASASAASASSAGAAAVTLEPGVYSAKFDTDSSMFHVNEANEGRGELTVTDEGMTIHVSLASKKITNLYAGMADQAQADSAGVIQPTTDTVTYSDGTSEEVYGFDVPVPALDEEFDVALLGEKGTWYDHKVTVSDPIKQ